MSPALEIDARNYYYQGAVSLANAVRAVSFGEYSWATVKAYYSVFYFLRSILAIQKWCLFYVGRSPYFIQLRAGNVPIKSEGSTHQSVLKFYGQQFKSARILSNRIGGIDALDWIEEQRNYVNYQSGKFYEPELMDHFRTIATLDLRQMINQYLGDSVPIFAFDQDHAVLAYPILVLREISDMFSGAKLSKQLTAPQQNALQKFCRDSNGPIQALLREFDR